MTPDEMRAKLMEGTADGSDQAGIVDDVVQAYADALGEIGTHKARVDELTKQVGTLTDTNLRLLEKVRYTGQETGTGGEKEEKDPRDVDINDLLKKAFEERR